MPDKFVVLADEIADSILSGKLRVGTRLPTQRRFADARGIAASTAGRVYGELKRRGLISAEVGRGSYVRADREALGGVTLVERGEPAFIDLETSFPLLTDQAERALPALQALLRPDALDAALRPVAARGRSTATARHAAGRFLADAHGWVEHDRIVFTGSGRLGIATAIAALVPPGGRLGVERLTYPIVRGLAARLGRRLVPIETDGGGVVPAALSDEHARRPLDAFYVQPVLHNPTGVTMTADRLEALATVVEAIDLPVIEDRVYGFLDARAPPGLAHRAPAQTVTIDGLSKRLAPGLSLGLLACPERFHGTLASVAVQMGHLAGGFAIEAGVSWLVDGTVARSDVAKRADAARRQALARRILYLGRAPRGGGAYHLWLELPGRWPPEAFVDAARERGVLVASGKAFATRRGHVPNAVRVGLGSPSMEELRRGLAVLAELLHACDSS